MAVPVVIKPNGITKTEIVIKLRNFIIHNSLKDLTVRPGLYAIAQ